MFLLEEGISRSIPIRDGLSYSQYELGQLIYGNAVLLAPELETVQQWIGISCSSEITKDDTLIKNRSLICCPVSKKVG